MTESASNQTGSVTADAELDALRAIVEGTAQATGAEFFNLLVPPLGRGNRRPLRFRRRVRWQQNPRSLARLLGQWRHCSKHRIRSRRHAVPRRDWWIFLSLCDRASPRNFRAMNHSPKWASKVISACHSVTPMARSSATSQCSTSGRCRPSRDGSPSSASSPPARPPSWFVSAWTKCSNESEQRYRRSVRRSPDRLRLRNDRHRLHKRQPGRHEAPRTEARRRSRHVRHVARRHDARKSRTTRRRLCRHQARQRTRAVPARASPQRRRPAGLGAILVAPRARRQAHAHR